MLYQSVLCGALLLALAASAGAQEVGPELGTEIDQFSLVDQHGTSQTLSELLQQGPTAFVFVRSTHW